MQRAMIYALNAKQEPEKLLYDEKSFFYRLRAHKIYNGAKKMNKRDNDFDNRGLVLRCPRCGYGIFLGLKYDFARLEKLILSKPRRAKLGELVPKNRKQKLGEIVFEFQAAVRRKWQVFWLRTTDIGTDYMIGKGYAKLQIQLRSSGIRHDKRYNFYLTSFEEDLMAFFVFLLIHRRLKTEPQFDSLELNAIQYEFYIIPTTEMSNIDRFRKAFETKTWKTKGKYNCTLSLDQARRILEKYKDEKGWKQLEKHT